MITAIKTALPLRTFLAENGMFFVKGKSHCPFHEDKTPSFSIYQDRNGFERGHCFGCGFDTDVLGVAMALHGLSFKDALKLLAGRAGLRLKGQTSAEKAVIEEARREREKKRELVAAFRAWERQERDRIVSILRSYRHMIATRTTPFTEPQLQTLAELAGKIVELEYSYKEGTNAGNIF